MFKFWPILLVICATLRLARSLVNVTIDDYYGDSITGAHVVYSPESSAWKFGPSCSDCMVHPDPVQARNATWHYGTLEKTQGNNDQPSTSLAASAGFYGSAVYVHCILSLSRTRPAGVSNMLFFIDSKEVGFYEAPQSGEDGFLYDVVVYSNDSLSMGNHIITIQSAHPDSEEALLILDYIVYSTDEEMTLERPTPAILTTENTDATSKNKVLTGVLVTVCLLFASILAYLLYRLFSTRRARKFKLGGGLLPTSTPPKEQTLTHKWLTRCLPYKWRVPFNAPSLGRRQQLGPENAKGPSYPPIHLQRQTRAILAPDEPELQHRPQADRRWASVLLWRDRTVREAEIPSLPPTSNAPTTVFSGPASVKPAIQSQSRRPQHHQEPPGTPRAQPQRKFTVMNS